MSKDKPAKIDKQVSESSRRHFKYRSNTCLNCSQPLDLSDVYCPYCSQLNSTKQLSLKDFFGEFFNSIVSYDSRLRYTIKDLLFKPGTITRNYVGGQRLKYANPFRFFLSISIIYFIVFGIINTYITDEGKVFNEVFLDEKKEASFENSNDDTQMELTGIPGIKFNMSSQDSIAQEKERVKDSIEKENPVYVSKKELDSMDWGQRTYEKIDTYFTFYENTNIKNPTLALDSLKHDNSKFNRWLYQRNLSIDKVKSNPYGFANYMLSKTPFFLFFFAPIFALFFWLFYARTKKSYIEHLIFIFHIFSFAFLAMFIASLVDTIFGISVFTGIFFVFIGPFYLYKSLRNFYKQKRFITIIKFFLLNFVFLTGATLFATLFFLVTAAIY